MRTLTLRPMAWPRTATCQHCAEATIIARGRRQGRPFILDAREVFPIGRCGPCGGRGHVYVPLAVLHTGRGGGRVASQELGGMAGRTTLGRVDCYACNGSGVRGEPLTGSFVALTYEGIAYPVNDPSDRQSGEALHRRHHCPSETT